MQDRRGTACPQADLGIKGAKEFRGTCMTGPVLHWRWCFNMLQLCHLLSAFEAVKISKWSFPSSSSFDSFIQWTRHQWFILVYPCDVLSCFMTFLDCSCCRSACWLNWALTRHLNITLLQTPLLIVFFRPHLFLPTKLHPWKEIMEAKEMNEP